jgi:uncharacterized protein
MHQAHFPDRAPIDAYGNGGFRFADMSHKGSILALPTGIYGWDITSAAQVVPDKLHQVRRDANELELMLFGWGNDLAPLSDELRTFFAEIGVRVEGMATGPAVRTYNVLLAENRRVGAALLAVS